MGIFTNRFYNNYNMQQPRYNRQIQYNNQQMQNNNQIQNNQPITLNDGVSLKPLTQEELEKINEEIRQNIENAKTQDKISNKDENIKALEDLIQDEKNSSIFYGNLSDRFYKDSLEKLSLEALEHNKVLKEYYRKKYGKNFEEKIITINQNLMAYSRHAIEYVCLHEICHLKYMDHSKKFWNMVENYMPDYKLAKKELKE